MRNRDIAINRLLIPNLKSSRNKIFRINIFYIVEYFVTVTCGMLCLTLSLCRSTVRCCLYAVALLSFTRRHSACLDRRITFRNAREIIVDLFMLVIRCYNVMFQNESTYY